MPKTTVRASVPSAGEPLFLGAKPRPSASLAPEKTIRSGTAAVLAIRPSSIRPSSKTLLAETAHDLNNALNVVRLQLDLLALDCGSADKVRQRLRKIQPAIEHAAEVTLQLLNPEKARAVAPRQTALNPVLQRMVPILSAMLPLGTALHLRLAPDLGTVAADPVEVVRIVSNLVLNSCAAMRSAAVRASDAEPVASQVFIETANASGPESPQVVLRVCDTGPGMSPSTRAHLFQPLIATKPRPERSGLGLASVLRMVRRAGGTIQVQSTPGKGTEITILLPSAVSKKQSQPSRLVSETAPVADGSKLR